jgi:hypothetical protein
MNSIRDEPPCAVRQVRGRQAGPVETAIAGEKPTPDRLDDALQLYRTILQGNDTMEHGDFNGKDTPTAEADARSSVISSCDRGRVRDSAPRAAGEPPARRALRKGRRGY